MMSTGDKFSKVGLYAPHVIPITSTSLVRLLAEQLCFACCRQSGRSLLSESVTFAPSLAARIPGNAVPHPS